MKITSQNDVGYLMTLAVITITSVLEFLKYIITVLPIRLTAILMIMSVSTFKTDVILIYKTIKIIIKYVQKKTSNIKKKNLW
jgi:uncharacterized membrane protein